ncbi:MAG: CoA transferase [Chloroflexi bacterium]|nr:CoA transferase [Chloroflexota bacterium]
MGSEGKEGALDGLKVLEYGDFISAPFATKLLADLGADVIKVERPGDGDRSRLQGPFPQDIPHPEKSGLYLFLNMNKRGVSLDPTSPDGHELFLGLARWADVLITNSPPKHLETYCLDYKTLAEANPTLVQATITIYGYNTPYRDWKGYALNATAASGLADRMGDPGHAPLWLPYCAADYVGGVHAAAAALLARRVQRLTGEGQHAWISLQEVLGTIFGSTALAQYVFQGMTRTRTGKRVDVFYPWEVVPCKDGYFEVITMVDAQWDRFVELMGNPPWKDDERFKNRWLAPRWAEELDAYWHPWFRERTRAELTRLFYENRIAFQPVLAVNEVAHAEHLKAREFWATVKHPVMGAYTTLGAPYKLSEAPWAVRRPPPLLGQHNGEVYRDLLGLSDSALAALQRSGVV